MLWLLSPSGNQTQLIKFRAFPACHDDIGGYHHLITVGYIPTISIVISIHHISPFFLAKSALFMFISPIYSRYIHMFPSEITIFAGKSSHSQWLKQIIPLDTNKGLKKNYWISLNPIKFQKKTLLTPCKSTQNPSKTLLNPIQSNKIPKKNHTKSQ